jgi:hypothetical protein
MTQEKMLQALHDENERLGLYKDAYAFYLTPEYSNEWKCYMFGNRPGGAGIVYTPNKGKEPNWFVRWMMKICFDCTWVKDKK